MQNIYTKKFTWKLILVSLAAVIVILSLWYSNHLVKKISDEERKKVSLWADAVQKKAKLVKFTSTLFSRMKFEERKKAELCAEASQLISNTTDLGNIEFIFKIIQNNTTVPVILTDGKKINTVRNLDSLRLKDTVYLQEQLENMKKKNPVLEIEYVKGKKNYLYYDDSKVFSDIKLVFDSLIKSFISEVAINTASVPVIYTDNSKKELIAFGNIDSSVILSKTLLSEKIARMASQNVPIEIDLGNGEKNFIFYEESMVLTQLKYYPFIQLGVIGFFLLIAYTFFSTARKAEQNQVWVGMSKETAHQLGTPLSSLMAWLEMLKSQGVDEATLNEINRDVERLNTITDRFSKIGSAPSLKEENIYQVLVNSVDYIKQRTSKNVNFEIPTLSPVFVKINIPLFEWVIENICKNAVDAMDGQGEIKIDLIDATQFIYIDITDTGKGISKGKSKTVFEPGFTTKKRGWGLGLSLCKRIIENYHKGKIFVKWTEPGKGTTFRIVLNK